MGELVIERGHRAILKHQNFINYAPNQVISQVLVKVFLLNTNFPAQVIFVALQLLIVYFTTAHHLVVLGFILRNTQYVLKIRKPRTVQKFNDMRRR